MILPAAIVNYLFILLARVDSSGLPPFEAAMNSEEVLPTSQWYSPERK